MSTVKRPAVHYKLIEREGAGSLVGDFDDTIADLVSILRTMYGTRLESINGVRVVHEWVKPAYRIIPAS